MVSPGRRYFYSFALLRALTLRLTGRTALSTAHSLVIGYLWCETPCHTPQTFPLLTQAATCLPCGRDTCTPVGWICVDGWRRGQRVDASAVHDAAGGLDCARAAHTPRLLHTQVRSHSTRVPHRHVRGIKDKYWGRGVQHTSAPGAYTLLLFRRPFPKVMIARSIFHSHSPVLQHYSPLSSSTQWQVLCCRTLVDIYQAGGIAAFFKSASAFLVLATKPAIKCHFFCLCRSFSVCVRVSVCLSVRLPVCLSLFLFYLPSEAIYYVGSE